MAYYTIYNIDVVDRVDTTGSEGKWNRFRLFNIDMIFTIDKYIYRLYIEHIWFFFCFLVFFGQIGGTVAQSVDGDVYFGWLKSLAWRRVAFVDLYIYILYRFCQIYCGNTHKHGRAWYNRFLWVIGYRDQSRNVEEEWRCIFVFVIIDISI